MYPVLMAADILDVQRAPGAVWGAIRSSTSRWARDMAASFNHRYGEHFVLPEGRHRGIGGHAAGLDGRKMSKSYDNTIPLFARPSN